jgi:two-component system OmpR family response regulator
MTQAHGDVRTGAGLEPQPGKIAFPALTQTASGWLALADPNGPIDLPRLFPEVEVRVEASSAAFSDALSVVEPALVVLIAPPAGPGDLQRVASWLPAHRDSCAVLLSPHLAVAARLHALELGFYDAVDLSSDPMEVVGRLSIAGRRRPLPNRLTDEAIPVGEGVELDRRARAIRRDGRLLSLRPKELALLEFLAMHPGRAFTREELLRHVWHDAVGNERMVDVYVFWLRSKIERDHANPIHLVTVRGSGYLFDPPKTQPSEPAGRDATFDGRLAGLSNVNEPPTQR